jgi:hypothetical protein
VDQPLATPPLAAHQMKHALPYILATLFVLAIVALANADPNVLQILPVGQHLDNWLTSIATTLGIALAKIIALALAIYVIILAVPILRNLLDPDHAAFTEWRQRRPIRTIPHRPRNPRTHPTSPRTPRSPTRLRPMNHLAQYTIPDVGFDLTAFVSGIVEWAGPIVAGLVAITCAIFVVKRGLRYLQDLLR